MCLNERLQSLRKINHLSQQDLAELADLSPQQIDDWEKCAASPTADEIVKLAKALEVSAGYLLGSDPCLCGSAAAKAKEFHRKLWIGATGVCAVGLLISITAYSMWQSPMSLATGVILQAISIIAYEALTPSQVETSAMRARFYKVNIWLTALAPCFIAVEMVSRLLPFSYPKIAPLVVTAAIYPAVCLGVSRLLRRSK